MRKAFRTHWFFILTLLLLSFFYLTGVVKIPFHPDESTLIYMSSDFEHLLTKPGSLTWRVDDPVSDVVRYRMIDAPITRYLLGFGRVISQNPPPEADWDWSRNWEENTFTGALPADNLLLIGRLVIAGLFPLTITMLYLIGLKINGRLLGIVIVLIFSFNPLILLHTRRAMAEGALVFGLVLSLYAFLKLEKYPFLVGLVLALAFNAKHSAFVLFPIGLLAVSWSSFSTIRNPSSWFSIVGRYLIGFTVLTLLLNPFLWRNPINAGLEAFNQRQSLLARQQADFKEFFPIQVLETPTERVMVTLAQTLIAPPIFAEVGNYREDTLLAENKYLQVPGNNLARNYVTGGLILGFILLGTLALIREVLIGEPDKRRNPIILILSILAMVIGYTLQIPFSWQRYSVPLIPFISILAGVGIMWGIKNSRRFYTHGSLLARLSQILAQFSANSRVS
jgi:4-amino-4-deoxy-L-arabinose transferase-like glycosyltransferase